MYLRIRLYGPPTNPPIEKYDTKKSLSNILSTGLCTIQKLKHHPKAITPLPKKKGRAGGSKKMVWGGGDGPKIFVHKILQKNDFFRMV